MKTPISKIVFWLGATIILGLLIAGLYSIRLIIDDSLVFQELGNIKPLTLLLSTLGFILLPFSGILLVITLGNEQVLKRSPYSSLRKTASRIKDASILYFVVVIMWLIGVILIIVATYFLQQERADFTLLYFLSWLLVGSASIIRGIKLIYLKNTEIIFSKKYENLMTFLEIPMGLGAILFLISENEFLPIYMNIIGLGFCCNFGFENFRSIRTGIPISIQNVLKDISTHNVNNRKFLLPFIKFSEVPDQNQAIDHFFLYLSRRREKKMNNGLFWISISIWSLGAGGFLAILIRNHL